MEDGSIRVAEVTEDSLGTYTCMPYNALGSMGWSPPAPLVLKVGVKFYLLIVVQFEEAAVQHRARIHNQGKKQLETKNTMEEKSNSSLSLAVFQTVCVVPTTLAEI